MSTEMRLELISLVEHERSIWDSESDDYRNTDKRERAWDRIITDMREKGYQCGVSECKAMWKSLRDSYKRNATLKADLGTKRQWFYMRYLNFLEPIYSQSNPVSNFDCNILSICNEDLVDSSSSQRSGDITGRKRLRFDEDALEAPMMLKRRADDVEAHDKFGHFGNFVASHLRDLDDDVWHEKIEQIITVLFHPVEVTKIAQRTDLIKAEPS